MYSGVSLYLPRIVPQKASSWASSACGMAMYRDSIDGLNTSPIDALPNVFTNSLLFTRHAPVAPGNHPEMRAADRTETADQPDKSRTIASTSARKQSASSAISV